MPVIKQKKKCKPANIKASHAPKTCNSATKKMQSINLKNASREMHTTVFIGHWSIGNLDGFHYHYCSCGDVKSIIYFVTVQPLETTTTGPLLLRSKFFLVYLDVDSVDLCTLVLQIKRSRKLEKSLIIPRQKWMCGTSVEVDCG